MFPCPVSAQRRQQHRRTLDGRLCAAAFVFDRQTHTGCSDSSNPAGEHGREWCYVDAQVARRTRQHFSRVLLEARALSPWSYAVVGWRSWGTCVGLLRFFNSCGACCGVREWRGCLFIRCGFYAVAFWLQHLVTHSRCRMLRHSYSVACVVVASGVMGGAPCSG